MDFALENELHTLLNKDEKLLWAGRPKTGLQLQPSDVFVIPFSLLWCGFAIFWETMVSLGNTPFFFKLWGIPFVCVGLYMVIGRFFADSFKRKNTVYGITENRVIIKSGIFSKETKSLNIKTISDITFKEKSDGTGTITLGPSPFGFGAFGNMGGWPGLKQAPALEMIEDARKVYFLLQEQQGRV